MPDAVLVEVDDPDQSASALALIDRVLDAASERDGQDAVDETTRRRLRRDGLVGSRVWRCGEDGFARRHDTELDLVVHPDSRGAGIGTALTRAALEVPGPVTAWSHGDDPAAVRIAQSAGLRPARALWVMRRATSTPLPPLAVPDDLTVRGYRDTDAAEVVRVNAAAFAHHPEQGAMDAASLAEQMAESWFDPAGLLVAEDADSPGDLLGFHWTKRHTPTLGEVYVVGIDPAAQGRGLGKVLTLAGLHHLADGGSTEVLLYVESDNAAARAVYSGLGFTHAHDDTHVQYRRD